MKPTWCFVVNELNVLVLAILALVGRRPCVVDIMASTPIGAGPLRRLVAWLDRTGRLTALPDLLPSTGRFWDPLEPYQLGNIIDWVPKTFDAVARAHGYDRLERHIPDYAEAAKGCGGNFLQRHIFLIFMLRDAALSGRAFALAGVDDDIAAFYRAYWGEDLPFRRHLAWQARWPCNLLLCLGAIITIGLRLGRSMRWSAPPAQSFFFAVDHLDDIRPRNVRLAHDIIGDDAKPLFVLRYPGIRERPDCMEHLAGEDHCLRLDGTIDAAMLPGAIGILIDPLRLLRAAGGLHPDVFRAIVGLAYWRLVYRAFFRRHKVAYFWCRDDYTPEHHMRSQEIRRIGGRAMGVRHGVGWGSLLHSYCHIDFDVLFHLGDEPALAFYRRTWPRHMAPIPIGSWGMTRAERKSFPARRPNNVVVATSNGPGGMAAVGAVHVLARAFPDRKVLFRPKWHDYPNAPDLTRAIMEIINDPPANVVVQTSASYAGLGDADYLVGNASSLAAEALKFGLKAFVLNQGFDGHPEPWSLIFRRYPFMLLADPQEAVDRIRSIEAGTWRYPREQAADMIHLPDDNPFDIIRNWMGLRPLD